MGELKAIAISVNDRVYLKETNAKMYVIRDHHAAETEFIFSIPYEAFSIPIREDHVEKDLENLFLWITKFDTERKEKMKDVMRDVIKRWHEYS